MTKYNYLCRPVRRRRVLQAEVLGEVQGEVQEEVQGGQRDQGELEVTTLILTLTCVSTLANLTPTLATIMLSSPHLATRSQLRKDLSGQSTGRQGTGERGWTALGFIRRQVAITVTPIK